MLTRQQLDDYKYRLMNMRDHMLDRIERFNDTGLGDSMSKSTSELSTYDNHPADVGTEMFERSKDFALREQAMLTVGAIDDALEKMNNGQYGKCEVCGKDINPDRLDAVPYTTQCVACKSQDEDLPKSHERTAEEDVLENPFSRSWKDKDEDGYTAFDGEDSWEEVAGWNEHAARSQAGAYYGDTEVEEEEDVGFVQEIENIPYEVGDDGVFYKDFRGIDDDKSPYEKIDIGYEHHEPGEPVKY
ncbi:TraR/DksA C4-type zinc finger protein [Desulforamulus aquiferis]|uniref:TraR/DksA C4-type zinc finger protein n=1 Tax=Desulforamulus aquiferis TaxID=1397668 RepID=A0AAW7Z9K0_9FIRM|nr:TraR/DksA C4-type zinc finger protein [Desulforamulus aquiferis]MDO7786200.1 TraR/DksA C4-type zinc finger protein [Desulforamulus aquiferis]